MFGPLFLLSVLFCGSNAARGSVQSDFAAPHFTLDLDAPPAERWKKACLSQVEKHGWAGTLGPVFAFIRTVVPQEVWAKHDKQLQAVLSPVVGDEMTDELRGIMDVAATVGQKVQLSELLAFQVFYEVLMQCTGIVARDPHGAIFHGRNMDIGLPVANITATVTWTKGGKDLLTTTQYLGYLGVHTGMRRGGWAVQANERIALVPGPVVGYKRASLLLMAAAFADGHAAVGRFLRETLVGAASFDEAIPMLSDIPLASPLYLIVSGRERGAVLTRDRKGLAREGQDANKLFNTGGHLPVPVNGGNHLELGPEGEEWFLVQTNWDPWNANMTQWGCLAAQAKYSAAKATACADYVRLWYGDGAGCADLCALYSDGRWQNATASMASLQSRDANPEQLFAVLSKPPVLNGGTRFTAVMSPATDHYTTTVRGGASGCDGIGCAEPDLHALRFLIGTMASGFLPNGAWEQ